MSAECSCRPSTSSTFGRNPSDAGLDQINIILPQGITGCFVSLVFQTGSGSNAIVSNTTTLAITASGSACSDLNGVPISASPSGSTSVGNIIMEQDTVTALGTSVVNDAVVASFAKYTQSTPTTASVLIPGGEPSIGSCIISISNSLVTGSSSTTVTGLDAGAQIAVTPPSGPVVNLLPVTGDKGLYQASYTSIPSGAYKFAGTGGADVGAFSATVNVPANLVWTNETAITANPINRGMPLTLTWTGGDPNSYAYIEGYSINPNPANAAATLGAVFVCIAPIGPGTFTVPPAVLLSLPASAAKGNEGILFLGSSSTPTSFSAPGLNVGYAVSETFYGAAATYQ